MPDTGAPPASQEKLAKGTKMAIGTLLPGLLMSALVIALGTGFSKRGRKDD
jgi:hypothetical protein